MAKGRMINKRIAKSDKLAALKRDRTRVLYFMIYPHVDCEGRYSADPRDIKEDCCPRLPYTVKQIQESLLELHASGLISLYVVEDKGYLEVSRFEDFQDGLRKEREADSAIPPNSGVTPQNSGNCRTSAVKIPLNLNLKSKFNLKDNVGLLTSIIEYLNQKTGKNFSPTSTAAVKHINARIAEGRTLEDFKRVIDVKARAWANDPKMNAYLRPETLFGSKMEAYLNEFVILSPAERERMVGAGKPLTPSEKTKAAADKVKIDALAKQIFEDKFGAQIEAARARGDTKAYEKITREAEDEFNHETAKIARGED